MVIHFDDGAVLQANTQVDGSVVKAGIKYVSGDITLAVGAVLVKLKIVLLLVLLVQLMMLMMKLMQVCLTLVASGVSAVLGYTTVDTNRRRCFNY